MNKLTDIQLAPNGGFKGIGTFAQPGGDGISTLSKIISMAIGVMTIVAIIWFVFILITGAIGIMGAGSDKQALESSRQKITTGVIGLVIVVISVLIIDLVGTILGIQFLNIGLLFSSLVK